MEYNTTHEQIVNGQRITTYISMTVSPVKETPSPDESTKLPDANYVEALIEAAIYNHYPPIVTPSEFKRLFALAHYHYKQTPDGTPAEKAAMAVGYSYWYGTSAFAKYDNALIEAEIAKHFPTIAKGAEFKAVYDKALTLFNQLALWDKSSPKKAEYAVKNAIAIVCPDECQPVTPTPAELISVVIAERWPAHLGLISTTNELKIAYRARAIFNEFAGSGRDKAVKAVEHAFNELVDKVGKELIEGLGK